jgi:DNA modification methylase
MTDLIKEYGLSHAAMMGKLKRAMGVERVEVAGENHKLVLNDSVIETANMEENSVGLIMTSIPFSSQYEYSPNFCDMGHSESNEHFFEQMDFLTPNLFRVLMPGRLACIHVKDRIVPGGMTGLGFQTVYPFHVKCIEHYIKHGFGYMGMKTIVTDVVRENNQTYRLGWTEQCKDGSKMGVGMPEYLLIFRKPPTDTSNAYGDDPVVKNKPDCIDDDGVRVSWTQELSRKGREVMGTGYSRARWQVDAHGFTRSSGNRLLMPEELKGLSHKEIFRMFRSNSIETVYNFKHHVKIGEHLDIEGKLPVTFMLLQPQSWHPDVWTDITRMMTLNTSQAVKGKQHHLCPMAFDLADRAIEQWSSPGEVVYDPFAGIGTVPYRAVLKGRYGVGCELSAQYFLDGVGYCKSAEEKLLIPDMFAAMGIETEDAVCAIAGEGITDEDIENMGEDA